MTKKLPAWIEDLLDRAEISLRSAETECIFRIGELIEAEGDAPPSDVGTTRTMIDAYNAVLAKKKIKPSEIAKRNRELLRWANKTLSERGYYA